MKLNFPNESRHFDSENNRVQFWGYDGAIEVSFFVGVDVLQKLSELSPDTTDIETGILNIFDAARERMEQVADKVYGRRGRKSNYVHCLAHTDF